MNISLQVPSVLHVTAGGAATAKTASQEKSATDAETDPLDPTGARKGEEPQIP